MKCSFLHILFISLIFFSVRTIYGETSTKNGEHILKLRSKLPSFEKLKGKSQHQSSESFFLQPQLSSSVKNEKRNHLPPFKKISQEEILQSEVTTSYLKEGALIYPLNLSEEDKSKRLSQPIMVKHFRLPDHDRFIYLINKKGEVFGKVDQRFLTDIREELKMHEEPLFFNPIISSFKEKRKDEPLTFFHGFSWLTGVSNGDYIGDLLEDNGSTIGIFNQVGLFTLTRWKLPFFLGLGVYFENTQYRTSLSSESKLTAFSFGPKLKTQPFIFQKIKMQLSSQIKISPFTKLETLSGEGSTFHFYSTDLLNLIEIPLKNFLGEFSLGVFFQVQWMNLRRPSQEVFLNSRLKTNQSLGLSLSQVFDL